MRSALLMLALVLLNGAGAAVAQTQKVIKIDGDGDLHLGTQTVIAGKVLGPGMYRLTLAFVNGEPVLTVRRVAMSRVTKGMRPKVALEVVKVTLKREVSQLTDPPRATVLVVRRFDNPRRQYAYEVKFKGERIRYSIPVDYQIMVRDFKI